MQMQMHGTSYQRCLCSTTTLPCNPATSPDRLHHLPLHPRLARPHASMQACKHRPRPWQMFCKNPWHHTSLSGCLGSSTPHRATGARNGEAIHYPSLHSIHTQCTRSSHTASLPAPAPASPPQISGIRPIRLSGAFLRPCQVARERMGRWCEGASGRSGWANGGAGRRVSPGT